MPDEPRTEAIGFKVTKTVRNEITVTAAISRVSITELMNRVWREWHARSDREPAD